MFSLLFHPAPDREDLLIAELHELGTTGITEEDAGLRGFFDSTADCRAIAARFAEFSPEFREEAPADWEQITRDAWPPMELGERFFLVAPWDSAIATPPGRLRLEIYPGMACGTGRHPATQLCLRAIEGYVRVGDRVLDVGSGSGILSDAARLMGASQGIACDVDPDAVGIASERVHLPMFIGSAEAVRSAWADVVIANIDAATLERIAPELKRVRKPESSLILSGFPEWDLPEGFTPKQILEQDEWRCFIC